MDLNTGPGAAVADSPAAPDFSTYARSATDRDLGRTSMPETGGPADSPTDSPAAPAAATAATPDAGSAPAAPGTPKDGVPTGQKNAKTRIPELDDENQRLKAEIDRRLEVRRTLRAELAALDRGQQPAAHDKPGSAPAATAPTSAELERYTRLPDAPKVEQFAEYEAFVAAQAAFVAGKVFEDRSAKAQRDSESRARVESVQQTIRGFNERYQAAIAADPTLESRIDPRVLEVTPAFALAPNEPVGPHNLLAQAIVESEAAPELLAHYSTDEGRAEWARIVKAGSPTALIREFLDLLRTARAGSRAGASAPVVPVSQAPDPPLTLGKKPAASPDKAAAAVAKSDFRAYRAAQDAADLARVR